MSAPALEFAYLGPDLTFTDPDLTDHYPRSRTSSVSSNAHPTGDSPPPRSRTTSRRLSSSSNETGASRSMAWAGMSPNGGMPNLSQLLDLLDDDDPRPEHAPLSPQGTPIRPTGYESDEGYRASGAQVPSSSTPTRLQTRADERARSVSVSPSHPPVHHFAPEQSSGQSAYNRSAATEFTLNPIPPRSPSLTGDIEREGAHEAGRASRRESAFVSEQTPGRGSASSPSASARQHRGSDQSDASRSRPQPNLVAQMADDVMAEFIAIVSTPRIGQSAEPSRSRTPNGTEHPPSRLPRIVTPTSPDLDLHPQQIPHPTGQSQQYTPNNLAQNSPHQQRHAQLSSPSEAPQPDPNWVARELREANKVIAHLQGELKSIRDMVARLKVDDFAPSALPQPPREGTRESLLQSAAREYERDDSIHNSVRLDSHPAAWEIARHLAAVMPAPGAPQPNATALDSLSLALAFARSVDALAHQVPKGRMRRDEDVFERGNLEGVLRRVRGWENAVRR